MFSFFLFSFLLSCVTCHDFLFWTDGHDESLYPGPGGEWFVMSYADYLRYFRHIQRDYNNETSPGIALFGEVSHTEHCCIRFSDSDSNNITIYVNTPESFNADVDFARLISTADDASSPLQCDQATYQIGNYYFFHPKMGIVDLNNSSDLFGLAYGECPGVSFALYMLNDGTDTLEPSNMPSEAPTDNSQAPSSAPSAVPTVTPSSAPSQGPSTFPSSAPTSSPSSAPTHHPIINPTTSPSARPSVAPSSAPSFSPTTTPTLAPTNSPVLPPTLAPSVAPTESPVAPPTSAPTTEPTGAPTNAPVQPPTSAPTYKGETYPPTVDPTDAPSNAPVQPPTSSPSDAPSDAPTGAPTDATLAPSSPTSSPTLPTSFPTYPTSAPSSPSSAPTTLPTAPSVAPSAPTSSPSLPTSAPSSPTPSPTSASSPETSEAAGITDITDITDSNTDDGTGGSGSSSNANPNDSNGGDSGDNLWWIWIIVGVVCLCLLVALILFKRRRHESKDVDDVETATSTRGAGKDTEDASHETPGYEVKDTRGPVQRAKSKLRMTSGGGRATSEMVPVSSNQSGTRDSRSRTPTAGNESDTSNVADSDAHLSDDEVVAGLQDTPGGPQRSMGPDGKIWTAVGRTNDSIGGVAIVVNDKALKQRSLKNVLKRTMSRGRSVGDNEVYIKENLAADSVTVDDDAAEHDMLVAAPNARPTATDTHTAGEEESLEYQD